MLYKVMNSEIRLLRESCTDASEAITTLEDFYDRLISAAYEVISIFYESQIQVELVQFFSLKTACQILSYG